MKYVKLSAENYNEALQQLRTKYGEDAIPISHKYVKEGGLFNSRLFAKEIVELTAAIQEPKYERKAAPVRKSRLDVKVDNDISDALKRVRQVSEKNSQRENIRSAVKSENLDAEVNSALFKAAAELRTDEADTREHSSVRATQKQAPFITQNSYTAQNEQSYCSSKEQDRDNSTVQLNQDEYQKLKQFEKDFYEVKASLNRLLEKQSTAQMAINIEPAEHENISDCIDLLKKNEYNGKERQEILDIIKKSVSADELDDKSIIAKSLKDLIKSKIITSGPVSVGERKKIVMFVGPTGVGKTTSLAKMGARLALRENKRVAFITIDNYRIAATEQLKKYAEIMGIPIHVVNDRKNLEQVIEKESAEVLLIDTSGRSHRNTLKISEIKSFADSVHYDFEKILCVSASTKRGDVESIFSAFKPLECNSVLITKVDETSFVGNVVTVADKYNKPISYIANGQEVPNDLYTASSENIADLIVNGAPQ